MDGTTVTLNLDALRDLMEARGIDSVSELARRTGLDRSVLQRIVTGERRARPSHIIALTRAVGARPRTLVGPPDPDAILAELAEEVRTCPTPIAATS